MPERRTREQLATIARESTPMTCQVCQGALNTHFADDGEVWYIHGQPWLDLEHAPNPVPTSGANTRFLCDFCRVPDAIFEYIGDRIENIRDAAGQLNSYDPRWTVCEACDDLIQRDQIDALKVYVRRKHAEEQGVPWALASHPDARQVNNAYFDRLWGAFLPTIRERHRTGPRPAEPLGIDPARLPKIRDRLAKVWGDPRTAAGYTGANARILPGNDAGQDGQFATQAGVDTPEAAAAFCRRMQLATQVADMYWVSDMFTRLAVRAGSKLDDMTITRDEMPAANGFLTWQAAIAEISGNTGRLCDVYAVGWTLVPGGMWIVAYVRAEDFFPTTRFGGIQGLREEVGWFFPANTGGGLPFDAPGKNSSSSTNLIATLFATWHLMRQPGIADTTEELPDKVIRKAYTRARKPIPTVHVVNLRKRARATRGPADATGARASWSYRVLVGGDTGGFWRSYWTGPGRTVKETRWIEPYLTGSDGMPLKDDLDVQTVKTLR